MLQEGYELVPSFQNGGSPTAATGLWRFLFLSSMLFFGIFPFLLFSSWDLSPCRTGTPFLLYMPPLALMLFVTVGEIRITQRLKAGGAGKSWEVFNEACKAIYMTSIMAEKMNHWVIISILGRMELLDANTNALQPGQAHACEEGAGPEAAYQRKPLTFSGLELSELFFIVAAVSFFLQGSVCFYCLWNSRNMSSLETKISTGECTSKEPWFAAVECYKCAAVVADCIGAAALGKLLAEASGFEELEATGILEIVDGYKNLQNPDPTEPAWDDEYQKLIRDNDAAAATARAAGNEQEGKRCEDMANQSRQAVETIRAAMEAQFVQVDQALGTRDPEELKVKYKKIVRDVEKLQVVFMECVVKVLFEAAPELLLLSMLFTATFNMLALIGKAKIALSFALSLFTCLTKGLKMFQEARYLAFTTTDRKMSGYLGILAALLIVVLCIVSTAKFAGAFYCTETHFLSVSHMACTQE